MKDMKQTIEEQLQQLQMLMHRKMHHERFEQFGKNYSPHRGQGRVLKILALQPEISQKELTYLLNMSKQAVAELISKLEKSGYITRAHDAQDKRVMIIRLTEEGKKAGENIDENTSEMSKLFDCLNADELVQFSAYLGRIIGQYEAQSMDQEYGKRRRFMEDFMFSRGRGFDTRHRGHHDGHGHMHGCRQCRPESDAEFMTPTTISEEQKEEKDD